MQGLGWLTARPIAHRGLHDIASGIVENTAAAFDAAIAAGYGIECDVQISADGEAMVHHDKALGRLTEGSDRLDTLSAAAIRAVRFKSGDARIMTLSELCDRVHGRTPLLVEIKSHFDGDSRIAVRAAKVLAGYAGPAAAMCFDPQQIEAVAAAVPDLPRGIVAERYYDDREWNKLSPATKRSLAFLLHARRTRPHFIAYDVHDLPALAPLLARWLFGRPLLAWTVCNAADRQTAGYYADQMIFEGFRPLIKSRAHGLDGRAVG
jgi:glycerophosphoryl diester phosphodiesterase